MFNACIIGTGSALPEKALLNSEIGEFVDTSDEWIVRRTGIKERRISLKEGEGTADLAALASQKAMEMADVSPEELDLIVVGTVTADRLVPSAGCMVQQILGAQNAAAFDISAGCSGFLYALTTVKNATCSGACKTALAIGVDRISTILNWKDRGTCILLGDGAGAVVVKASEKETGILSSHLKSDGRLWELLYSKEGNSYVPECLEGLKPKSSYLVMDGNRLFKKAVNSLTDIANQALKQNNLSGEDISILVPHQANMRIIQATAQSLDIPFEKFYINVDRYGNTSSASIPLALDEANRKGLIKKGDYVMLITFGAGLTWGSTVLRWCF
ncbi:beta-ketoacyl-ACP synthase III [Desulfobacterium sp. N47]|uniref:Beta-ketoacyl-[acyl-carrier-protein] synthase III n=1 Tax=uncultured Desulfobacterium sp. TaxID=201089 RepID=E1YHI4_9BACT|nr:3-oxoacyl-[acyl-carrier-protein] synthase 3 [uncultured Desulfobacterium sp.]